MQTVGKKIYFTGVFLELTMYALLKAILKLSSYQNIFNNIKFSYLTSIIPKQPYYCSVPWGCRIHRLFLGIGVWSLNECPGYVTKQSDGEVPLMQELRWMLSIPSLPLFLGPIWPGVEVHDRILSLGQIELNYVLTQNWIASILTWN